MLERDFDWYRHALACFVFEHYVADSVLVKEEKNGELAIILTNAVEDIKPVHLKKNVNSKSFMKLLHEIDPSPSPISESDERGQELFFWQEFCLYKGLEPDPIDSFSSFKTFATRLKRVAVFLDGGLGEFVRNTDTKNIRRLVLDMLGVTHENTD